jgi:hypothetical protein
VIGRDHDAVLPGQQGLGVEGVPHVAPDPIHAGGHDAVIRAHLAPQPRAEPRTSERVCRPGDLRVIGSRDDMVPLSPVALRIWLPYFSGLLVLSDFRLSRRTPPGRPRNRHTPW